MASEGWEHIHVKCVHFVVKGWDRFISCQGNCVEMDVFHDTYLDTRNYDLCKHGRWLRVRDGNVMLRVVVACPVEGGGTVAQTSSIHNIVQDLNASVKLCVTDRLELLDRVAVMRVTRFWFETGVVIDAVEPLEGGWSKGSDGVYVVAKRDPRSVTLPQGTKCTVGNTKIVQFLLAMGTVSKEDVSCPLSTESPQDLLLPELPDSLQKWVQNIRECVDAPTPVSDALEAAIAAALSSCPPDAVLMELHSALQSARPQVFDNRCHNAVCQLFSCMERVSATHHDLLYDISQRLRALEK